MIIQEREPVVYTTSSTDWSAASVILAVAVMALFGFMIYYFAIMHAAKMDNMQPAPSSTTVIQQPVPNTVVQPMPVPTVMPQPILVPTPSQVPQASAPSTPAPADTSSSNESTTTTTTESE
jgi:hypothetical protein